MRRSGKGRYKVNGSLNKRFKQSTAISSSAHPYGDDWEVISAYVRKRDGYRCQIHKLVPSRRCNGYYPPPFQHLLHAHHLIPRAKGGPDHPRNLLTICTDCHSFLHNRQIGRPITDKQKRAARKSF